MTPIRAPILVVGSASRDIATDDPRGWRLGGAVMYAGLALARLGIRTRVLAGVDAAASTAPEIDGLRAAGAEVDLVALERGPVFENVETPTGRTQTCLEPGDRMPPEVLPAAWATSPTWLLGPVAAELDDRWASLPPGRAFVALGWQGLLRELPRGGTVRRRRPQASAIVSRADLIAVGRDDLDAGTAPPELLALLRPGTELLLTDGRRGGLAFGPERAGRRQQRGWRAIAADREIDATGAGDAFLAAALAARLAGPAAGRLTPSGGGPGHLRFAAALASLTVEAAGLAGIPTRDAVDARLRRVDRRRSGR